MTRIMQTTGADLPAKEIKGQRVVSYKQIAELHQVDVKNLQKNFQNNQQHFIEGTDYFKITERHPHTENFTVRKMYFTESGYLMLVKSLTDDLSWEVQRLLVNGYFRAALLDKLLPFLPHPVQKVVYYRSLGLTQAEVGKLLGLSKDAVKRQEHKLKSLGYRSPNLSGYRSLPCFTGGQS